MDNMISYRTESFLKVVVMDGLDAGVDSATWPVAGTE